MRAAAASGRTHVDDATQGTNGIGPEDRLGTTARVLHDRARHHYYVLGGASKLLDDEVHHLAEARILVLEELRDAEEEGGGFVPRELLPRVEEERDLGQEYPAFPRLYGRAVE